MSIHRLFLLLFTLLCFRVTITALPVNYQPNGVGGIESFDSILELYDQGKYDQALAVVEHEIAMKLKVSDTYDMDYAFLLNYKSSLLYRTERDGSIEVGKEAIDLVRRLIGRNNEFYCDMAFNLATYCYAYDRYPDCVIYENEALDVCEKLNLPLSYDRLETMCQGKTTKELGIDHWSFMPDITLFDTFGSISQGQNHEFSNMVNARARYERVKLDIESKELDIAKAAEDYGLACAAIGDTAMARRLIYDAACLRNACLGENSLEFLRTVLLHADIISKEWNNPKSTDIAKQDGIYVITRLKELNLTNTSTYVDALILVGIQYAHISVNGSPQINEALKVAETIFGTDSPEYDRARFAHAQILSRNGFSSDGSIEKERMKEIIQLTEQTYHWRLSHLGHQHRDCLISMVALATYYEKNGQFAESTQLFGKFVEAQSQIVKENFIGMSYEQQRMYWEYFQTFFQRYIPRVLWRGWEQGNRQFDASVCYNATLFSKGILLRSFTARHESELMGNQASYDRFISNLSCTWKDVQRCLGQQDAAIEFVSFTDSRQKTFRTFHVKDGKSKLFRSPIGNIDQNIYGALLVTPHLQAPIFIPLCDLNSIGDVEINGRMQNNLLYQHIWQPLLPYLKNVRNVYFSPSRDFSNIPIESLAPSADDKPISTRFNLYRLSSTCMLAEHQPNTSNLSAAVYGGINYEMTTDEMLTDKQKYPNVQKYALPDQDSKLRGQREGGDSYEYLEGTEKEAQYIYKCFESANAGSAKLYNWNLATETSLKALSGHKIKVMHIGTHGFYVSDKSETNTRTYPSYEQYSAEDLALMRSGLLFAGAQNSFEGETLPESIDDGILTAQEISYLDFYGLDMVSLSACQTGQGDITSDGVFGLQRGFKKAGAKSILMSLWMVDDKATQALMTEFYHNWITLKMSKYNALEAAKNTIRNTPGWSDYRFWAPFILLDGLD